MIKKIHYCKCRVNLSGQNCHIVVYDEFNPVTWPEVQVLMALHGEENVMDVMPVAIGEAWANQEKDRLRQIYGPRVVEACFPGRAFRMELMMTGDEELPAFVEGKPSIKVPTPGNGDDDEDDDDETVKAMAAATSATFKPSRHSRPTPPPETPKEA
jgi:hypothetical protein